MKATLLLIYTVFLLSFSLQAQETCTVKLKDIKGVYTGACVDGKANGAGKSVGTDQYEGEFKDGYPKGKGTYIWKDGHYFVGMFKGGNKEGKGDMYYEAADGKDSVITGYWKKDKYYGEYEKQFIVVSSTSGITKVDCRLIDRKGEDISITVHQLSAGGGFGSAPTVNNITTLMGTFYTKNEQQLSNSSVTKILQVTFPFKAIFYTSNNENVQILFNEKGNYDVYIDMR